MSAEVIHTVFNVTVTESGPPGPKGEPGTGVMIRGTLADVSLLPSTGEIGEGYLIARNLWLWEGTAFTNVGQIQGPQGEQGIQGPQGEKGEKGDSGPKGDTGLKGDPGESVELRTSDTHIQWRYVGGEWQNLVALSDLQWIPGEDDVLSGVNSEDTESIEISGDGSAGNPLRANIKSSFSSIAWTGEDNTYTSDNLFRGLTEVEDPTTPRSAVNKRSLETALNNLTTYETLTPGDIVTVQVGTASLFRLNLDRSLTSITFSDPEVPDGNYQQFTMILKQGTGSNLVEWPENIRWSFGNEPALSFSQDYEDVITFVRHAQSTVWYGFFNGGSFHV